MKKHPTPPVWDLVMTVINDGNGGICGASYSERVDHTRKALQGNYTSATPETEKWVRTAAEWMQRKGYYEGEEASRSRQRKIFKQAANEIFEYYSSN